jgi:hypothetical protein
LRIKRRISEPRPERLQPRAEVERLHARPVRACSVIGIGETVLTSSPLLFYARPGHR